MAPAGLRPRNNLIAWLGYLLLAITVTLISQEVIAFAGPISLLYAIVFVIIVITYSIVSLKAPIIPFLVLVASVGMLRYVWMLSAPILPDLFMDRISMVWLVIVFFGYSIYNRIPLRKPFTLDFLLLAHAIYIAARVLMTNPIHFHTWTQSVLTPYVVYFLAKNIVQTKRQIRMVLIVLITLSVYYTVTSIAEKFHIAELLFPRMMIEPHPEAAGRSSGPFRIPGTFGNTIGMLLPVFLYFISQARLKISKILFGFALLMGFVGLFFTYTRGSILGAAIGLGVVVFLNRKTYLPYVLPVLFLLPFVAINVIGVKEDEFLEERIEATNPIESRIGSMVTGFRMWRDYPLFGCGPYQYRAFAEDYVAPIEVPIMGTVRFKHFRGAPAHDMYIGPMAEDGIIGMLLQYFIYFTIVRISLAKLSLRRQNDHFATYILPLFFGIYTIYFFGGLITSFRHLSIMGSLFYMAAGITYGYTPEDAEENNSNNM